MVGLGWVHHLPHCSPTEALGGGAGGAIVGGGVEDGERHAVEKGGRGWKAGEVRVNKLGGWIGGL